MVKLIAKEKSQLYKRGLLTSNPLWNEFDYLFKNG